jgi:anti-anti-sigma regulatory factor
MSDQDSEWRNQVADVSTRHLIGEVATMSLQFLSCSWEVETVDSGIMVTLGQEEWDSKAVWVLFDELFELAVEYRRPNLYVDFANVRRLAGIVFGKLITLDKKLRAVGCRLVLCNVDPGLYQSFRAARLTENLTIEGKL